LSIKIEQTPDNPVYVHEYTSQGYTQMCPRNQPDARVRAHQQHGNAPAPIYSHPATPSF